MKIYTLYAWDHFGGRIQIHFAARHGDGRRRGVSLANELRILHDDVLGYGEEYLPF